MMKRSCTLFLIGLAMVALHNFDNILLYGFDPFPLIIMLPYVVIALLWKRIHRLISGALLGFFATVEGNHTLTEHWPKLVEQGLGRGTISAVIYDIGVILWLAITLGIFISFTLGKLQGPRELDGKRVS